MHTFLDRRATIFFMIYITQMLLIELLFIRISLSDYNLILDIFAIHMLITEFEKIDYVTLKHISGLYFWNYINVKVTTAYGLSKKLIKSSITMCSIRIILTKHFNNMLF